MSIHRARNTNAYLNALNQEQKNALSNVSSAANYAARKILYASGQIKNVHPMIYDSVGDEIARDALVKASKASWNTLLAAKKTYQKGNHAPATKEKEVAQKTHELQTFMSEITTNMNKLMKSPNAIDRPHLRTAVYQKILLAKNQAKDVKNAWERLSQKSSQEAGGKTRRNKKSRRSRRSRRSRH